MVVKKAYESVKTEIQTTRYKGLKLFWIFLLASLIGAGVEILFVGLTAGEWMSRSSLLYGQFSVVWGLGAVLMTVLLHRLADKNDRHVFFAGTLLGGAYEYLCSLIGELVFGVVFWDYSGFRFNIGGRVNLLYCFFWGIAAVLWIKHIYPRLSRLIERFFSRGHRVLAWVVTVAMVADMALSAGALIRYGKRQEGAGAAANAVEEFLDRHYDDDYMEHRYQNMTPAE